MIIKRRLTLEEAEALRRKEQMEIEAQKR